LPIESKNAQIVDGLAQRYGQLPSAILAEPASVLRLIALADLASPPPEKAAADG
jgi:hypothetical protein